MQWECIKPFGLFDMHVHFFYGQGEHKNTCQTELTMMLANGITAVRILAGHLAYLKAKDYVRSDKWAGPELFIAVIAGFGFHSRIKLKTFPNHFNAVFYPEIVQAPLQNVFSRYNKTDTLHPTKFLSS